ncbi:hypothetical protein K7X08_011578 [Anisodus acutangulus]|uniref:Uncharacterized protein n=1 Tax=Anisodus acutangulus TaxID=402998 RepID=A0A9Q1MJT9_9SOLA|nr:hypothetical protein K7X08_011578 [Anisodus acutangulus]
MPKNLQVNETSTAAADYKEDGKMRLDHHKITGTEGKIVCVENSTCLSTTNTCKDNCLKNNGNERVLDSVPLSYLSQSQTSSPERVTGRDTGNISAFISEQNIELRAAESSTEDSAELPEQMIYLDDIQEFESTLKKYVHFQDQRLLSHRMQKTDQRARGGTTRYLKKEREGNQFPLCQTLIVQYTTETYVRLLQIPKRQNRKRNSSKSSAEESHKSYCTFAHESKDLEKQSSASMIIQDQPAI